VVLWNDCRWDNAGCCGGAVRTPDRTDPKAMVTTGLIVMATYLLPVAVGVGASLDRSARKAGHVPGLARRIGGAWLGAAMMAGGLVSTLGLFNALLLTSSRVPYAMAACGMAPVSLARLHLNHGTPWAAILVNAVGCALLVVWAAPVGHERGPFGTPASSSRQACRSSRKAEGRRGEQAMTAGCARRFWLDFFGQVLL